MKVLLTKREYALKNNVSLSTVYRMKNIDKVKISNCEYIADEMLLNKENNDKLKEESDNKLRKLEEEYSDYITSLNEKLKSLENDNEEIKDKNMMRIASKDKEIKELENALLKTNEKKSTSIIEILLIISLCISLYFNFN